MNFDYFDVQVFSLLLKHNLSHSIICDMDIWYLKLIIHYQKNT